MIGVSTWARWMTLPEDQLASFRAAIEDRGGCVDVRDVFSGDDGRTVDVDVWGGAEVDEEIMSLRYLTLIGF